MEESSIFTRRGLPIEVETTESAELDFQLEGVAIDIQEAIGRSLKSLPTSFSDSHVGTVSVRQIQDFDAAFRTSRFEDRVVVTLFRIWRAEERSKMLELLEAAEKVGLVRGVFGV